MWVTWSSTLAFFFLISFSTNSSEVTHFCLTANEGASRYRFCTGQHLWRDSTLSIYGKSLGAVPINSDDITAECTVTWPSLPQRCKISDGTEFSGKREKGKHCNCNSNSNFQPMDTRARNNFRIVSGHDDRPNSFLLGHVSFLAGQMCLMMSFSMRDYCKQWL